MKKEYLQRLREIAQAQLVDEIGRKGLRFFTERDTSEIAEALAHILASTVASEINGSGQYPALKQWIDDIVQDDIETAVIDEARGLMREAGW